MAGPADEHELARAGRPPATIGRNRGQIQRPRDRLDAHRVPLGRHAISPSAAQPLGSVLVSFTPVRSCSPANANRLAAQARYARGRWWMARRSPRKRVRGQPLRGFKSHLHRRWPARTPVLTAGRRTRRGPLGLIWWSQLGAACGPIAGLSRSCRAWSPPSRTTLNTSTHAAESCAWRFTEPAALPGPGTSAMPVRPAAGSAAARRMPFL